MDLAKLDTAKAANEGFELALKHPGTGASVGIYITLLGRDSDTFRTIQAEHNRRRVARMAKGGMFKIDLTPEEVDRDALDLLSSCTKSWRQVDDGASKDTLTLEGDELECTKENAEKVYSRFHWIREQVDSGVTDRANFTQR